MPLGFYDWHLDELHEERTTVGWLMRKAPVSCPVDATVRDALERMFHHGVGVLPVVDGDGRVVGIATDRDLARAVYERDAAPAEIPLADAMTTPVHTVRPDADLTAARELLREHRIRRLPVVDGEGRLVGILSIDDLARAMARGPLQRAAKLTEAFAALVNQPEPR